MPEQKPSKSLLSDEPGSAVPAYYSGVKVFARLFSRWMDSNGWSHPVMTSLAACCMDGKGWLHSSQIAGLRHAQTKNPGPRTFVAIERLNYYLWLYTTEKKLLPNTESSRHYVEATPITEDGQPPSLGWFIEVFCGYRLPKDANVDSVFISPDKVQDYCLQLGRLLRRLITQKGFDLLEDRNIVIYRYYPTHEEERVARVEQLIMGEGLLTQEELQAELLSLSKLTGALGGPATEDDLLAALQQA